MNKSRAQHDYFSGKTDLSICFSSLYSRLMTREWVNYEDVFPEVWERHIALETQKRKQRHETDLPEDKKRLPKGSYSNHPKTKVLYKALKTAKTILFEELKGIDPNCVEPAGALKKGGKFRYVGTDSDPLCVKRDDNKEISQQRGFQRYMQFCKDTAGLIPMEWVEYFIGKQIVANDNKDTSATCISADVDHKQRNIELLPRIYEMIVNERVIRFHYKDFQEREFELVFHPQYLKEYNGRWQLFGETDGLNHLEKKAFYNVALDRIEGDIFYVVDEPYRRAPKNRFSEFFADKVGVTEARNVMVEGETLDIEKKAYRVRVRAINKGVYGLVSTKKIFAKQETVEPWDDEKGYGEFEMKVQLNNEFCGKILQLGAGLQVVAPEIAVKVFRDKVRAMWKLYE